MEDGSPTATCSPSGEIMAGNILGKGYLAGFGMTIGTVFGRIAGQEAASHAAPLRPCRMPGAAMEICNACRYCEGFCAVFPAMELRREFTDGDLSYLANLCHNCRGCYYACQYAPPHSSASTCRRPSPSCAPRPTQRYAWPRPLAALFQRNGLIVSLVDGARHRRWC